MLRYLETNFKGGICIMELMEIMATFGLPSICLTAVAAYYVRMEEVNRKERREDKEIERQLRAELLETNKHILATSEDVAETNRLLATGIKDEVSTINSKIDLMMRLTNVPGGVANGNSKEN